MNEPTIIDAISDEVFKDKIRSFNRIMGLFIGLYFVYITAVFVLAQLSGNNLYLVLIIIPLFLLAPFYKKYRSTIFYLKLNNREDYQQYAKKYPLARMLYDRKFERRVLMGFVVVAMGWLYVVKYGVSVFCHVA